MESLVWIGAALSLCGILGLLACIWMVVAARRAGLDEAGLKARLQRAVAWNLAALLTSALGLIVVIVGLVLS